jgi:hypothetical protein
MAGLVPAIHVLLRGANSLLLTIEGEPGCEITCHHIGPHAQFDCVGGKRVVNSLWSGPLNDAATAQLMLE